ncbi:MAG: hypothetical protein JJU05_16255 [Verrucomicrobia bacterium]|nr:hypothetical protein [Verrucomicrobiota bacterium]MCH8528524.1 hypothetical protein [Kiritimatiellia bacterium]
MSGYVLFQMYSGRRAELIAKNEFYLHQARKRLLSQFEEADIRKEANEAGEQFLVEHERYFNPDVHDGSEFQERAYDALVERYELLTEMRDNVRLSTVAGLFHEWEKNLRQWLVDEILHWYSGKNLHSEIWKKPLTDLFALLESFGWDLRASETFQALDACGLVVNVYKHGNGRSLHNLANRYPRFLNDPFGDVRAPTEESRCPPGWEYLKVTDQDLDAFSKAISAFWRDVPENVLNTQIEDPPDWFMKAYEKDQVVGETA